MVLRDSAWCCVVLRGAAWCCVVLRGAVMLHTSLRVVLRDDEPTTHAHAMTSTRCEQPPSLLHYLSSLHPTTLPLLNLPPSTIHASHLCHIHSSLVTPTNNDADEEEEEEEFCIIGVGVGIAGVP